MSWGVERRKKKEDEEERWKGLVRARSKQDSKHIMNDERMNE